MSRPHIRGPGYSGSMSAPGYEVPYASNYDSENQFFTGAVPGSSYVGDVGDHWYAYPTTIGFPTFLYDIFGGDDKGSGRASHGGHGHGGGRGGGGRGGERGDGEFPWTTFAWASLAVVGAGVLVFAVTKGGK